MIILQLLRARKRVLFQFLALLGDPKLIGEKAVLTGLLRAVWFVRMSRDKFGGIGRFDGRVGPDRPIRIARLLLSWMPAVTQWRLPALP
jgi:hypothetical protein